MKQTSEKLVPITRLGKFFGGEDFDLDIGMGQEWLEGDMNFTIVLYRIDRYKTKKDDVYGEVMEDGIQFMAPVELKGLVQIMPPTNKFYGNSKVEIQEPGNMKFSIYQKQLEDLKSNSYGHTREDEPRKSKTGVERKISPNLSKIFKLV